MGFDPRRGFVELRLCFFGFSGAGLGSIATRGKGGILGGGGGSCNIVALLTSTSLPPRSSGKRSSSLMNALGARPGREASDFPDGQLGKAQVGPDAAVLDEYRGKISSIESVGDGVKPFGEPVDLGD